MYTDGDNYPNLKTLPSDLENALEHLSTSEVLTRAFGEKNITSYSIACDIYRGVQILRYV